MKTGLILEGGAMRGMFTCGVIDVMMEHGITYDGAIGVSAGAVFGCNYKSKQIGRGIRYNKRFCNDKRYCSMQSFLKTGDIYNVEFCYHTLPDELDPFDYDTYRANPMEFYAVATDVVTGRPVYHKCPDGGGEDMEWFRASASIPLLSRVVHIGDYRLLDGGMADSIPLAYFESIGYNRNVLVLTRPLGYLKQKNEYLPLMRAMLHKYPNMIQTVARRHTRYNKTLQLIADQEAAGQIYVIRPPQALDVGSTEKDPEKLEEIYQIGRTQGELVVEDVQKFLGEK